MNAMFWRRPWQSAKRLLSRAWGPRMVYGWCGADGIWRPHTRVSNSTHIDSPALLQLADHVYVGHFNTLDASAGLTLGEGVQVTTHCALLTHSSHQALRLAGRAYWGAAAPPGFVQAATHIGAYTFIGPHSVVAPGSRIGCGVLVRAFSYVSGEVPDFAVVGGQPAQVIGDTRQLDKTWLSSHPEQRANYEAWVQTAP